MSLLDFMSVNWWRGLKLFRAAADGNLALINLLLAKGADPNAKCKAWWGWGELTPVNLAVSCGHLKVVQALLHAHADPNSGLSEEGITALIGASGLYTNDVKIVRALLEAGARVNARSPTGDTALTMACMFRDGQLKIVRLLLEAHAEVNAETDSGYTPLMYALQTEQRKIVKLLIAANANIHAEAKNGYTVLMAACEGGNMKIVQELLNSGAEVNVACKEPAPICFAGKTALMCASDGGHPDIVRALLDAGAEVNAKGEFGSTALREAQTNMNSDDRDKSKRAAEIVQMLQAGWRRMTLRTETN